MKKSPFRMLMSMYVGVVLVFSGLFCLPFSTSSINISFFDALFLSASALSGTGLTTIPYTDLLSTAGQWVLLLEIQIGCVGIMAIFTYIVFMFGTELSLPAMMLMSVDQNQKGIRKIRSLFVGILVITFLAECIGSILMYSGIRNMNPSSSPLFLTLFHSVSSFANAGFDLFDANQEEELRHSTSLLWSTSGLMFIGVLGFPTILELARRKRHQKISLFSKTNLTIQGGLMAFAFVLIFGLEFHHSLTSFSWVDKVSNAFFFSISSRNAGMTNLDVQSLSTGTFLFMLFSMFIGTSSGSTGGGIRTTTFAVILAKCKSIIKGQTDTHLFRRTVPEEDVNKAVLICFGYVSLLFVSVFVLACIEPFSLRSLFLEAISALTTAGISLGITPHLSLASQLILIALMIIGRIGVVAFIYFFVKPKKTSVKYIKETMMIG